MRLFVGGMQCPDLDERRMCSAHSLLPFLILSENQQFFADTCLQFCRENGCMKPSCEAVHAMWLPFCSLQATTTETKEDRVWKTETEPKSQHMVKSQDPKRED